ncbi:MAG: transaldolase family protein, transaldolase [Candidatus Gottesmanbacteria bacterium GW2011_GWA2_43_14]|uniref:Transaldolase family protein, transaldolase n=1 Tax=Candidatus Gottesmanbacteria bacterium GW2011_GWA2_43_14 TaxID=1618443 RepID=A0A0G1DIS0_9BACT|nr:MAG: transaldolase family protein, transaldolase [Candidatus Gottesmanbacteria bacterium GW2011_GWA2_43_14]
MQKLPSKIFIDGGLPQETKKASGSMLASFGYPLDGQTTNPTLIARNLAAKQALPHQDFAGRGGEKLTEAQALEEYKRIVVEMSAVIPAGSVSIQVTATEKTTSGEMLEQARDRNKWIPNASIKFPATLTGLAAAGKACREMPINITLVFSQNQAAAVYEVTRGAKYPIFISPFVGRLDDIGQNGMHVVKNILKMFQNGDGHVEVLTASVRNLDHILYALQLKSEIITIPFKVFQLWAEENFRIPDENYAYEKPELEVIPYKPEIQLGRNWEEYDLSHGLTERGLAAFYKDWTSLF